MLGTVLYIYIYIYIYIISLYCPEVFSHLFNFFVVSKGTFKSNFKTARKKDFAVEQLPIDSYVLQCKQNNSISFNK